MTGTSTLLELSTATSRLVLRGPEPGLGHHPAALQVDPALSCMEAAVMGSPVDVSRGRLELPGPLLVENARYDLYLRGSAPRSLETAPGLGAARLQYAARDLTHYTVSYRSAVGETRWTWRIPDGDVSILLEVYPTKLDYRRDFAAIKQDLTRLSRILLVDLHGVTGAGFTPTRDLAEAPVEWLEQVRRESGALRASMRQLLPRLRPQARDIQVVAAADRLRGRRPVNRRTEGLLALGVAPPLTLVRGSRLSEATALNGHLRWEVDRLLSVAQQIGSSAWFPDLDDRLRQVVEGLVRETMGWRTRLLEVPAVPDLPHLQTRLRDPLYARAFGSLRRLRGALEQRDSPELLGIKDLALLYEYWVFLTLVERLRRRFSRVRSASPSLTREIGGQLYLTRGLESRLVLASEAGDEITCYYNRAFTALPTVNQRPDITIELGGSRRLLIVDAKYRLGRSPRYLERHGLPGPEEEDINVLHRYRDAIVELDAGYPRRVIGGVIAFPGSAEEDDYRAHRLYRSWSTVGIAGVPMLPGKVALLDELLASQFLAPAAR